MDAATGGWWDLKPEDVTIVLERADDSVDGPVAIEVTISSSKDNPGSLIVDATEPVRLELITR